MSKELLILVILCLHVIVFGQSELSCGFNHDHNTGCKSNSIEVILNKVIPSESIVTANIGNVKKSSLHYLSNGHLDSNNTIIDISRDSSISKMRTARRNTISVGATGYFSGYGVLGYASIEYNRIIPLKDHFGFALNGKLVGVLVADKSKSRLGVGIDALILLGGPKNYFEFGAGGVTLPPYGSEVFFNYQIGYRVQAKKGFTFRVNIGTIRNVEDVNGFGLGLYFGHAF